MKNKILLFFTCIFSLHSYSITWEFEAKKEFILIQKTDHYSKSRDLYTTHILSNVKIEDEAGFITRTDYDKFFLSFFKPSGIFEKYNFFFTAVIDDWLWLDHLYFENGKKVESIHKKREVANGKVEENIIYSFTEPELKDLIKYMDEKGQEFIKFKVYGSNGNCEGMFFKKIIEVILKENFQDEDFEKIIPLEEERSI